MFIDEFLNEIKEIVKSIDKKSISNLVKIIKLIKDLDGRIFFAGSGGGAGHSSHAVCDFRKLLEIESYSITDNASELTARINDEGWDSSLKESLKIK